MLCHRDCMKKKMKPNGNGWNPSEQNKMNRVRIENEQEKGKKRRAKEEKRKE